jgi:hypothetical protein
MKTVPLTHSSWTSRSLEFPEHPDYFVILPQVGRIIAAHVIMVDPLRYGRVGVSYIDVEEGLIKANLGPNYPWKEHRYHKQGKDLVWDHGYGFKRAWQMIPHDELPDWFDAFRDKALRWMDARGM